MPADAGYDRDMVAPRRLRLSFCAAMALMGPAIPAHAAQVLSVEVTRDGARFLIGMHVEIDAPPPAVFRALQDYPAMMRYNPDLRAVRVQPTGVQGRVRLFTAVHTCVLIFCKTMYQEQLMTAIANADGGVLQAEVLPHGDFKAGYARWTVGACATASATTCLDARIELVPTFWVPPIIGPWALRRRMAEEAHLTSAGLEVVARTSRAQAIAAESGSAERPD